MNEKQLDFLKGVNIDANLPLDVLEDKVADYLQLYGFDKDNNPTKSGLMCESILDYISEQ